ncbi:MAG: O-antigen ligase family protein [Spirochaetia bacterium]|nr:O-antigen ligase family protein [Spirochaetia bacterium]
MSGLIKPVQKQNLFHYSVLISLSFVILLYAFQIYGPDRRLIISLILNFFVYISAVKLSKGGFSPESVLQDCFSLIAIQTAFHSALWFFHSKYAAVNALLFLNALQLIITFTFFYIKNNFKWHLHLISLLLLNLLPPFSLFQNLSLGHSFYLFMILAVLYAVYRDRGKFQFDSVTVLFIFFGISGTISVLFSFSFSNASDHLIVILIFFMIFLFAQFASETRSLLFVISPSVIFLFMFNSYFFMENYFSENTLNSELNANLTAMSLEFLFFLLLIFLIHTTNKFYKIAVFFALVLVFAEIFMTHSRGAIGAVSISVIFLGFQLILQKMRLNQFLRWTPLFYGISAASILLIVFFLFGEDPSFKERIILYRQTVSGIFENPIHLIFGTGDYGPYMLFRHSSIFNSDEVYTALKKSSTLAVTHPHSDFFSLMYGSGILGTAVFFVILFSVLIRGFKHQTLSLQKLVLSAYIFALLIHGLVEPAATQFITGASFWFTLGILWSGNFSRPAVMFQAAWKKGKSFMVFALAFLCLYLMSEKIIFQNIYKPVNALWSGVIFPGRSPDFQSFEIFKKYESQQNLYWKIFPFSPGSRYLYAKTLKELISLSDPAFLSRDQKINYIQKASQSYCISFSLNKNPLHCNELSEIIESQGISKNDPVCGLSFEDFQNECKKINPFNAYSADL